MKFYNLAKSPCRESRQDGQSPEYFVYVNVYGLESKHQLHPGYRKNPVLMSAVHSSLLMAGHVFKDDELAGISSSFYGTFVLTILQMGRLQSTWNLCVSSVLKGDCFTHEHTRFLINCTAQFTQRYWPLFI